MTLPRKGDRVRVTAVPECCPTRKHYLGEEYVLANDAVMHPIHPGYCAFSPEPEGWVSPVKVEILEQADIDWAGATPAESFDYRCGYTAGLRRAQELARDPAVSYQRRGSFAEIDLNAFDRAIDAEAGKERT